MWDLEKEGKVTVGKPPTTDYEKAAMEEAKKSVEREMKEAAKDVYSEDIKEIIKCKHKEDFWKDTVNKKLREVNMTREELAKMM